MTDPRAPFTTADLEKADSLSGAVRRYRSFSPEQTGSDLAPRLRQERRRAWLEAAVPALTGSRPAEDVCRLWSEEADRLLREAFQECFQGDIALFALGKLGSRELNLSSDVDLLLVARHDDPAHLNSMRRFQKLLGEGTREGFVFRVDFDLRPGGRHGPLIPTVDHFIDYYGNYGETWERMAFVRLRDIAGAADVIREVREFAERFSFRKHLDFTLLEELKSLRAKIHAEHWKRAQGGRIDLKLGIGGIRDVELFFHALQVIHGGKNRALRVKGTGEAARLLSAQQLLPAADADFLLEHYWRLRALENFVQALEDQQTHLLNPAQALPEFLRDQVRDLPARMEKASRIVATLLGEPPPVSRDEDVMAAFGDEELKSAVEGILRIPLLSRHRERDEHTRRALLKRFFELIDEQKANRRMAVEQLQDFLKSTRAKGSFFTLLLREEKLLRELSWLFGHSRYLGGILCFRPELLDSFIYRAQDLSTPDTEALLESLAEKRLLGEIIEGSRFLRDPDLEKANRHLTLAADEIVTTLADHLRREIPNDVHILALGKWGGREMGFRSDLDLIFVTASVPRENDLKFAKRLFSRLTETHRAGRIYPVDLRLRPSGKAGPLVIAWEELQTYLRDQAAPWERQAYLRARWLVPHLPSPLPLLAEKAFSLEDLRELNRIRQELLPNDDRLDLKQSAGGLIDIELSVQTLALQARLIPESGNTLHLLQELGLSELREAYYSLRQIEQWAQLISTQSVTRVDQNSELIQELAALLNMPSANALQDHLRALLRRSEALLERLDPRRGAG
ncbi:MAG: glutamine-synthetase adenylyltransferase [Bdellovibrionaceae bacterium]|nr:glutamine-synthetase adenylyltransferase [Pseudobdellovibrionaceae bacterium]